MKEIIKTEIMDDNGVRHTCILVQELNNQNGQMLYTFRNESNGNDFTIGKNSDGWAYINGILPTKGCIKELGEYLDKVE